VIRGRAFVGAGLAVAGLVGVSRTALARDPQRAADLFNEGRQAMASGAHELACQKFAESQSEDPREGTLINLALCEESLGKLAVARQYWQQASDLARAIGDSRVEYDEAQFARIDGRVPRLTIRLDGAAPPETSVTRDGIEFGPGSLGVPLPVDAGRHLVRATAQRRQPREFEIELHEGEASVLAVAPGPPLETPGTAAPAAGPALPADRGSAHLLRPLIYSAGGLGIVGLVVGSVFGVRALDAAGSASGHCIGDVCDPVGAAARRDELSNGNAATIAFASGGGLVAAASLLWALTPSPSEAKHRRRNVAYVVGAAGLVSTVLGGVLGVHAIQAQRQAGAGCSGNLCDSEGAAARRDAIRSGDAATAFLGAGGALLAGAITLWATDPRAESSAR
jgi:hypothetical protein